MLPQDAAQLEAFGGPSLEALRINPSSQPVDPDARGRKVSGRVRSEKVSTLCAVQQCVAFGCAMQRLLAPHRHLTTAAIAHINPLS